MELELDMLMMMLMLMLMLMLLIYYLCLFLLFDIIFFHGEKLFDLLNQSANPVNYYPVCIILSGV